MIPGLNTLISDGIALIDDLTGALQVPVSFYAWIADDNEGGPTYASAITVQAIVEDRTNIRRPPLSSSDSQGREIVPKVLLTIPRPLADNGAATRKEPIDPRDKFVIPGATLDSAGPILWVEGIVDPATNRPYMYQVHLG